MQDVGGKVADKWQLVVLCGQYRWCSAVLQGCSKNAEQGQVVHVMSSSVSMTCSLPVAVAANEASDVHRCGKCASPDEVITCRRLFAAAIITIAIFHNCLSDFLEFDCYARGNMFNLWSFYTCLFPQLVFLLMQTSRLKEFFFFLLKGNTTSTSSLFFFANTKSFKLSLNWDFNLRCNLPNQQA